MRKIIRTSAFSNGFYNKDRFLISLFFILGAGILIGSVTAASNVGDDNSILSRIYASFINAKAEQSFFELFFSAFIPEFIFLFACYISGLCAIGIPILYLIPLIYGIGKGVIFGFLYASGGFFAIINAILFHYLQNVGLALLIIISLKTSRKMSGQTFRSINSNITSDSAIPFKKYNQFYIAILMIAILLCIIDALMFKINIFN